MDRKIYASNKGQAGKLRLLVIFLKTARKLKHKSVING
jgi:hypothetical protein